MRRRDLLALGLAAVSTHAAERSAFAQAVYPERPIRLIIPFPPGGGYDATGRPWADGYTILLGGSSTHITEAAAYRGRDRQMDADCRGHRDQA